MKQYLLLISWLLCISLPVLSQDQAPLTPPTKKESAKQVLFNKRDPLINPVLIAGFNVSRVWGDQLTGYRKFGFTGGAGAYIRLPKHFYASFEILYSQEGAKSGPSETMTDSGRTYNATQLNMNYINVPFMINYMDKKRAIFGLGVTYTNLISFKDLRKIDTADAVETPYIYSPNIPYHTEGLEFIAAITLIIAKHYGIDLGYHHSLININSEPISYSTDKNHSQQMDYLSVKFEYLIY